VRSGAAHDDRTGERAGVTSDAVPPAQRSQRPVWRDPRLWVGVVLVAASVVAGARVLASADDTVQVWTAASDLGAGQRLDPDDLVAQRVRFADAAALGDYFTVDDELPAGGEVDRVVRAGELLPRSAVGAASSSGLVEVPIAVDAELVPPSVGPGDTVDVYVVAPLDGGAASPPDAATGPALSGVSVVAAPDATSSFGTSGKRQLVLAVPEAAAPGFFALVGQYDLPAYTVVRRG
jgi:Flp pilus assembly protein CpaB